MSRIKLYEILMFSNKKFGCIYYAYKNILKYFFEQLEKAAGS